MQTSLKSYVIITHVYRNVNTKTLQQHLHAHWSQSRTILSKLLLKVQCIVLWRAWYSWEANECERHQRMNLCKITMEITSLDWFQGVSWCLGAPRFHIEALCMELLPALTYGHCITGFDWSLHQRFHFIVLPVLLYTSSVTLTVYKLQQQTSDFQ